MGHPLRVHEGVGVGVAPRTPQWPSYRGRSTFVGTSQSGKVNVWYDASLGAQCLANARALVAAADAVVAFDSATFGTPDGVSNVIVFALSGRTDGTGGADHNGCDFQTGENIEVCAAFGHDDMVIALFEAELSECQMRGTLCGLSTGEALSRWCAKLCPGGNDSLGGPGFAAAPVWARSGMPDWVNQTAQTDGDYPSIGCGMAFVSWLISLGKTLAQIAQGMVSLGDHGTLAQLYARLIGDAETNAWPKFQAAVRALPGGVVDDDPFRGSAPPMVTVPTVVGMTEAAATAALAAAGLGERSANAHQSTDLVASQFPTAGTQVLRGSVVALTFTAAPVTVPNVVGQALASALATLAAVGLHGIVSGNTAPTDIVAIQVPAAGAFLSAGSSVILTVTASGDKWTVTISGTGSKPTVVGP